MGSSETVGSGTLRTVREFADWGDPPPRKPASRDEILDRAGELINGDRAADYGSALANHQRIAALWTVILHVEVTPVDVAMCMAALKLARLANDHTKADSWIDLAGYAALGGEMAEAR